MKTPMIELAVAGRIVGITPELLERYGRPVPRYTSYPTAPEWDDTFGEADLRDAYAARLHSARPLSLYVHIPFCSSLCLYCGCNVVISRDRSVARPYLDRLKKDIDMTADLLDTARPVDQIHWGGGTPTYLSAEQIVELYEMLSQRFRIMPGAEVAIEIEPRTVSQEQLVALRSIGFNRVSMGVQDLDDEVQRTIRRVQSYDMTRSLFDSCRELAFESINVDLIYGLPHQTVERFLPTIDQVVEMGPDRIALFSYAHVPWMKKQQGSFARHLPDPLEKFSIFCAAADRLQKGGYRYIGLDHFVREGDELAQAQDLGRMGRNFQGYTARGDCDLLAFGVSAIGAIEDVYIQNQRDLPDYNNAIDEGRLPVMRGIRLDAEDRLRRKVINQILCKTRVTPSRIEREFGIDFSEHFADELGRLRPLERDGLVKIGEDRIQVTSLGRIFIRAIAAVFDAYLVGKETEKKFSRAV